MAWAAGAKMKVVLVRFGAGVERAARNSHTLAIAEKLRIDVYYIVAKFQVQQTQRSGAAGAAGRSADSRQGSEVAGGRKKLKKLWRRNRNCQKRHSNFVKRAINL